MSSRRSDSPLNLPKHLESHYMSLIDLNIVWSKNLAWIVVLKSCCLFRPSCTASPTSFTSLRRRCLLHPTTCSAPLHLLLSFCVLSDFQCNYIVGLKELVSISLFITILQVGTLVPTSSWRGLDLIAFSWVLIRLYGTTTQLIGLQSGVIYVSFSSALSSHYELTGSLYNLNSG